MRTVIIANARSGSGKAIAVADRAAAFLQQNGVIVDRLRVGPGLPPVDPRGIICGADAVAIAGGDGTVLSTAPACIAAGVPIYHLAAGNENLFAREFDMRGDPPRLLAALRRGKVTRCDVARCSPIDPDGASTATPLTFLLMASIGPDASVVHRLHASRERPVGHKAYLGPLLEELNATALPRLKAWCDGAPLVDGRGMLVVANCRQYGMGVNPCPAADMTDGVLDVAFIPADTPMDAVAAMARMRLRWDGADVIRGRGTRVRVQAQPGALLQVDGEAALVSQGRAEPLRLEISLEPGLLAVLDGR